MAPGVVAGHYKRAECFIDVRRAAQRAGFDFIDGSVGAIDLRRRRLALACGREIDWDLLSLNTGVAARDPGREWKSDDPAAVVAAKPVGALFDWIEKQNFDRRQVAVVGAGAAGNRTRARVVAARANPRRVDSGLDRRRRGGDFAKFRESFSRPHRARIGGARNRFRRQFRGCRLHPRPLNRRRRPPRRRRLRCRRRIRARARLCRARRTRNRRRRIRASRSRLALRRSRRYFRLRRHRRACPAAAQIRRFRGAAGPFFGARADRRDARRDAARLAQSVALFNDCRRRNARAFFARGAFCGGGAWVWRWKQFLDLRFARRFPRQCDDAA